MHSSRMRTARALTVSGGGFGASQKKLWGKKIEKKRKKNFGDPPEKLETPRKIEDTSPPGPDPPTPPPKIWRHPPCEQNHPCL